MDDVDAGGAAAAAVNHMEPGWTSLLWLLGALAMVAAISWLLKRSALVRTAASNAQMRLVATLSVGTQQRMVTVEVGSGQARRWLVVGVTAQNITLLHTMEPQADMPAGAAVQPSVTHLLQRLRAGERPAP